MVVISSLVDSILKTVYLNLENYKWNKDRKTKSNTSILIRVMTQQCRRIKYSLQLLEHKTVSEHHVENTYKEHACVTLVL